MHFSVIDVETANADCGSICQIGIAEFADGRLAGEWSTLVDPETEFSEVNISIHGITPSTVQGQPRFPDVAPLLRTKLEKRLTVCHTHFDRIALAQAFENHELEPISTTWLDSARVARRTWPEVSRRGYGLASLCKRIGYQSEKQHDALEDAKAAGFVLLAALRDSQLDLESWKIRASRPITPSSTGSSICRDGNPDGDLYGEVIVFTGTLDLPRREAAYLASAAGCRVEQAVTKETTILVVGDQDISVLGGFDKSSKHRKAERLAAEGGRIRILCERDFRLLIRSFES